MVQRDHAPDRRRTGGGSAAAIRQVAEPIVHQAGYDLEDLSVSRAGRRYVVRMLVDSDKGVDLDAVAAVSRAVSTALDAAEEAGQTLIPGEYTLEVSSPGVDRALTQPRHWRRNVGRLVKVKAGERQVAGRVVATDGEGVHLEVDGQRLAVPYGQLGPGHIQLDFSRIAKLPEPEDHLDDEDDDEDEEGADE